MPIMICERCSGETAQPEKCKSCGKKLCRNCVKSMKKLHKLERIAICKDCWGDLAKRGKFKSAR